MRGGHEPKSGVKCQDAFKEKKRKQGIPVIQVNHCLSKVMHDLRVQT